MTGPLFKVCLEGLTDLALHEGAKTDVLQHCFPWKKSAQLKYHHPVRTRDQLCGWRRNEFAIKIDLPFCDRIKSGEHIEHGGLTAT